MAETVIFSQQGYKIVQQEDGRYYTYSPNKANSFVAYFLRPELARANIVSLMKADGVYGKTSVGNATQYITRERLQKLIQEGRMEVEFGDAKGPSGAAVTVRGPNGKQQNFILENSFAPLQRVQITQCHDVDTRTGTAKIRDKETGDVYDVRRQKDGTWKLTGDYYTNGRAKATAEIQNKLGGRYGNASLPGQVMEEENGWSMVDLRGQGSSRFVILNPKKVIWSEKFSESGIRREWEKMRSQKSFVGDK